MRPKMPDSQRAKQFIPFKPLEGLDEALHRVEMEHELKIFVKPVVDTDQAELIDRKLRELLPGDHVCVEVFAGGMRRKVSGEVSFIDGEFIIIGGQEIAVEDIPGIF